jgi:hypothetical protein
VGTGKSGGAGDEVAGGLCAAVRASCVRAEQRLGSGAARDTIAAVRCRLEERTLRVAVGGRLNAGKSTLVNALLGSRLAATDATECTMVVAWFEYGPAPRVLVMPCDGEAYDVPPGPGGTIPSDLRPPGERDTTPGDAAMRAFADRIASVRVSVPNRLLADRFTVVDTPGMDSLSGLDDTSLAALADADALLYVMRHPSEGDRAALEWLRRHAASAGISAANTLAVLTGVDVLGSGDDDDPWRQARRVASSNGRALRGLVSGVVPVIGLLAQTALADTWREEDTRLLASLAAEDRAAVDKALFSHDEFLAWDSPGVDAAGRARLFRLLGRHGIRAAIELSDAQATPAARLTTRALLAGLREASGIDALLGRLDGQFVRGADRLRAAAALERLDALAATPPDGDGAAALAELADELAVLRAQPGLRQLELAEALTMLGDGRLTLADDAATELVALATGNTDAERLGLSPGTSAADIVAAADAAASRWRRRAARLPRRPGRHAYAAAEFCQILAQAAVTS